MDEACYDSIMIAAAECAVAASRGEWTESTSLWRATQRVVSPCTNYVDWYNIMKFNVRTGKNMGVFDMDMLGNQILKNLKNTVVVFDDDYISWFNFTFRRCIGGSR